MLVPDSEVVGKAKRRKGARKKTQGIWGERGADSKKIGPILPDPSLASFDRIPHFPYIGKLFMLFVSHF